MTKYVAYYRVSTNKQGYQGLGMEAQHKSVANYLDSTGGELVEEYTEVKSGRKGERPELEKALRKCKLTGFTLLIAKLDRLSRNASFLLSIRDSNIKFVASDMPEANNLTIGLMACLAEYESELISTRTREALKVAKSRGVVLGNPRLDEVRCTDITAAQTARIAKAKARNGEILDVINEMQSEAGKLSLRAICRRLNDAGYKTSRGKDWQPTSVKRILAA